VAESGLQRDAASQGIAEEVGLFEAEVRDERGDVVGHQLVAKRAIDVGGVPMGL